MSRLIFPGKLAGETVLEIFDFSSRLAVGETISSASTSAIVYSGADASPSTILSGGSSASGAKVTQKVTSGVVGVTYLLMCSVVTSLGQTLSLSAYLAVLPDSF